MFGGFKARLNLLGGKGKKRNDQSELTPDMFVTGAYRVNKEDFYGYSTQDPIKSRPVTQLAQPLRPVKSTSNLVLPLTANPNLRNSTPAISRDPRGAEQSDRNSIPTPKEIKNQEKERKKLEKQRLDEQKKRAQEQEKQEKLIQERAKKAAQKKKQKQAPVPRPQTANPVVPQTANPVVPQTSNSIVPQTSNPVPQPAYSTNTLDSSISRSSGPPPYSQVPNPEQAGGKDKSGNVVYSKPVDTGSWDIISQHREQITRPVPTRNKDGKRKQMVMDLNYNFGTPNNNTENSDA